MQRIIYLTSLIQKRFRLLSLGAKRSGIEEVILRLSSENKVGWGKNFFLDFTTSRIIVSKKNFMRKFVDMGYIAGMAPFPYMVLSKNLKLSDLRKGSVIIQKIL